MSAILFAQIVALMIIFTALMMLATVLAIAYTYRLVPRMTQQFMTEMEEMETTLDQHFEGTPEAKFFKPQA